MPANRKRHRSLVGNDNRSGRDVTERRIIRFLVHSGRPGQEPNPDRDQMRLLLVAYDKAAVADFIGGPLNTAPDSAPAENIGRRSGLTSRCNLFCPGVRSRYPLAGSECPRRIRMHPPWYRNGQAYPSWSLSHLSPWTAAKSTAVSRQLGAAIRRYEL